MDVQQFKKGTCEWSFIAKCAKVDHDAEDIDHQLFTVYKILIEDSRLCSLIPKRRATNIFCGSIPHTGILPWAL